MRSAFAPPKKGETFELRAGLVYVARRPPQGKCADQIVPGHSMLTNGKHRRTNSLHNVLMDALQERSYSKDHHGHDPGERCLCVISRCPQKHCNVRSRPEEAGVFISHVSLGASTDGKRRLKPDQELREITSRPLYPGCQYVCARLRRPQPAHPCPGDPHNGVYTSGQDD